MAQNVYEEIIALFKYNPPQAKLSREIPFSYPNVFYDRHLEPGLCLKHIKATPSIAFELAGLVHEELIALKSKSQPLPGLGHDDNCFITDNARRHFPPHTKVWNADWVARFCSRTTILNCVPAASTIALCPHAEAWSTILNFLGESELQRDEHPGMIDSYVLRGELEISKVISSCLDDELCQNIRAMSDEFRSLAAFQFHVPSTRVEGLFREMDAVTKRGKVLSLQWPAIDLVVSKNISPPPIPDSESTIKSLPCIMEHFPSLQVARRNVRLSSQEKEKSKSMQNTPFEILASPAWPTLSVKPSNLDPDPVLFIQRAWTRAVESDATFIIFNCGNYERIGFRHRGSQTLFLSDLINVSKSSRPAYGQIQIGLYMAILRDALDRIRLIKEASTIGKSEKKESGSIDANRECEGPRTRLTTLREQQPELEDVHMQLIMLYETGRRNLALLRLKYGMFNSPAPAILHRVGHSPGNQSMEEREYSPEEYFHLTLTSEIAEGATGKVHDAKIEVQASDGRVYSCKGVVKVALGNDQRQKLRHEYDVYQYMALRKVNYVASVYGLFEDAKNEATILAMGHVGTSLATQPHYREHWEVSLTEEQKKAFKGAMTEIHQAGVRHCDVRPENLMMDDKGRATIIDFDMAKIWADERSRQREFEYFCCLLDGHYNMTSSPGTSVSGD